MLVFRSSLLLLAVFCILILDGTASIGVNLSLLVAVPLTNDNFPVPDPGWIQLASALLAVDHFNARDSSVVAELKQYDACPIRFDTNNITVMDTGTHLTLPKLAPLESLDAIAGPFHEMPALELSVIANTLEIPIVAHKAFDNSLANRFPYFSQVSADSSAEMAFLVRYLEHVGRTNYIAVLYSSTSASAMQKVDILRVLLLGMDHVRTFPYRSKSTTTTARNSGLADSSVRHALERVLETGFRTIVWISDDMKWDAMDVHEAASDLELDQGRHLWIVMGGVSELSCYDQMQLLNHSHATFGRRHYYLNGAAFLNPHDAFAIGGGQKFQTAFFQQNHSFVERLEALTPIQDYYNAWSHKSNNNTQEEVTLATILHQIQSWWVGSAYLYDAVMAIGIGACEAAAAVPSNTSIKGELHLQGIRSVNFTGATGRIAFGSAELGSRQGDTIPFAVINLLPPGNESLVEISEILDPSTGEFIEIVPFVYADGTTNPPMLLRDTPDQNYLSDGVRMFGLSLMTMDLVIVALSAIWVFCYRHNSVLIAAQPVFLYALCVGCAVNCSAIWFNSVDEGQGFTEEVLNKACLTSVWLGSVGSWIIFGTLFTKLWRVNRLMVQKASHISIWIVVGPAFVFSLVFVGVLTHWTLTTDYGWERTEIDPVSGASIGQCWGEHSNDPVFWIIILLLQIPIFLTARMAYKTIGVDDLYSEAKWVLIFLLVQIQVTFVGAPVQYILSSTSRDGFFLGTSLLYWSVPVTAMGLIVFPKVLTVRRTQQAASNETDETQQQRRQSLSRLTGEVVVSPSVSTSTVGRRGETAATNHDVSSLSLTSGPRIQIVTFD